MLRATNRASFAAACLSLLLGPGLPAESAEVEVGRQDCLRLIRHAAGDHSASDHAAGDDLAADSLRKGGSADRTVGATDFGDAGAGRSPEIYRVDIDIHAFGRDRIRRRTSQLTKVELAIALTKREIAALYAGNQDSASAQAALEDLERERAELLEELSMADRRPAQHQEEPVGQVQVTREGVVYWNGRRLQEPSVGVLTGMCRELVRADR